MRARTQTYTYTDSETFLFTQMYNICSKSKMASSFLLIQ